MRTSAEATYSQFAKARNQSSLLVLDRKAGEAVKSESELTQSCLTLRDPMDCSLPGSSAHGIFQARVLEWGAIAFSEVLNKSP